MTRGVVGMLGILVWVTSACGGDENTGSNGAGGSPAGGQQSGTGGAAPGGSGGNVSTGGAGNGAVGGGAAGRASGGGQSDGAIGSGSVECTPVAGGMCSAGTVCCDHPNATVAGCVSSFSACSCYGNEGCPILGCDGPEDCPGQHCCASIAVDQSLLTTWCRAACLKEEFDVCHKPADCTGSNPLCKSYGGYVDVCF